MNFSSVFIPPRHTVKPKFLAFASHDIVKYFVSVMALGMGTTMSIDSLAASDQKDGAIPMLNDKALANNQNLSRNEHMTDDSEWQITKETREYDGLKNPDGSPMTFEIKFIRRNDGLTVERVGLDREKWEIFLVKGSFGEFKFVANRWDEQNNKPADRYIVHTESSSVYGTSERDRELCISHSKDIESALYKYPVHRIFNMMPIKDVLFDTGKWTKPHYVHAREM